MTAKVRNRIEKIEAVLELLNQEMTVLKKVLKKELDDGGASKSSARKGVLSEAEKAKIQAKLQKTRTKKPSGKMVLINDKRIIQNPNIYKSMSKVLKKIKKAIHLQAFVYGLNWKNTFK